MSESSDDSGDVSDAVKVPPMSDKEGRGSQGEGGVIEVQAPSHAKNQDERPLTRGDWHCEEYGPDSRGPRCWLYRQRDLRVGLPVQSRQACDDLIALLVELRERLP